MHSFLYVSILLMMASVQAKTYLDVTTATAIIYYMQNENINASVCTNISEQDLQVSLQASLKSQKCRLLSQNGVNKNNIEANLPVLKKKLLSKITDLEEIMTDMVHSIVDGDNHQLSFKTPTEYFVQEKKDIEAMTFDKIFQKYQTDAQNIATIEKLQKFEDLSSQIEQFAILAR